MSAVMGALFGNKGGKGGTEATDILAGMAQDSYKSAKPANDAAMQSVYDAISTGGVEARQPAYSQAVEKTMQAGSQMERTMADDLARTKLAGTPFGMQMMNQLKLDNATSANRVATDMETEDYWKTLGLMFPAVTANTGLGMQGQGQATGFAMNQQMMDQQMMWNLLNKFVMGSPKILGAT